jgi:hypothetical protein
VELYTKWLNTIGVLKSTSGVSVYQSDSSRGVRVDKAFKRGDVIFSVPLNRALLRSGELQGNNYRREYETVSKEIIQSDSQIFALYALAYRNDNSASLRHYE